MGDMDVVEAQAALTLHGTRSRAVAALRHARKALSLSDDAGLLHARLPAVAGWEVFAEADLLEVEAGMRVRLRLTAHPGVTADMDPDELADRLQEQAEGWLLDARQLSEAPIVEPHSLHLDERYRSDLPPATMARELARVIPGAIVSNDGTEVRRRLDVAGESLERRFHLRATRAGCIVVAHLRADVALDSSDADSLPRLVREVRDSLLRQLRATGASVIRLGASDTCPAGEEVTGVAAAAGRPRLVPLADWLGGLGS